VFRGGRESGHDQDAGKCRCGRQPQRPRTGETGRRARPVPAAAEPEPAPPAVARVELWRKVPRRFYHLRAALGDRAAQRRVDREQRQEARLQRLLGTVPGVVQGSELPADRATLATMREPTP